MLSVSGLGPRDVPIAMDEPPNGDDEAREELLSWRKIGGVSLPGIGDCIETKCSVLHIMYCRWKFNRCFIFGLFAVKS